MKHSSSIKNAKESDVVNDLFEVIKKTPIENAANKSPDSEYCIDFNDLRSDVVVAFSQNDKNIIKSNFPKEKKGYLVVSKVISS